MATHSSILVWRIPGMGKPGGLPSMGLHSQTRLKQLSSSSSGHILQFFKGFYLKVLFNVLQKPQSTKMHGGIWGIYTPIHPAALARSQTLRGCHLGVNVARKPTPILHEAFVPRRRITWFLRLPNVSPWERDTQWPRGKCKEINTALPVRGLQDSNFLTVHADEVEMTFSFPFLNSSVSCQEEYWSKTCNLFQNKGKSYFI